MGAWNACAGGGARQKGVRRSPPHPTHPTAHRTPSHLAPARTPTHPPTRPSLAPASILGVGAPEALLVGVVALLVFGPKGLAEAVKAAGKTLRSFQPTLRELASVSSDLRNTLEEQIGLDEIRAEFTGVGLPPAPATRRVESEGAAAGGGGDEGLPSTSAAADALEEGADAAIATDDIDALRAASEREAWGGNVPPVLSADDAPLQGASLDLFAAAPPPTAAALETASVEELEAELARRRADLKAVSLAELEAELKRRKTGSG